MTTEPANRAGSMAALLPLVRYGRRYLGRATAALAALTISSAATLAVPFALRSMIDFGFSKESGGAINVYFLAMGALVVVIALAAATRYYLVTTLGERVVADLRRDVFAHLSRLDASFYDSARTGELVSRLTADTTQIKAAFGASASIALRNLFMFVGATALMVYTSPKLSALVLVAIPVIAAPLIASGRVVRRRSRRAQDTLAEATAFASESLGAARTMQAFGAEGASQARFGEEIESAYRAARDAAATRSLLIAIAVSLAFCSVVFVLWLGARDVLAGRMSGGLLSQFVLFAVLGATSLGELSQVWNEVSAAAGSAGRIAELLAVKPRIVAPAKPTRMPSPPRGAIEFRHVAFSYPSAPESSCPGRPQFLDRAGRTGRDRRPLRGGQVDHIPAHHALLRRRRGPDPCRWRRRQSGRSKGSARAHRAGPAGGRDLWRDGRRKHRLWARRERASSQSKKRRGERRRMGLSVSSGWAMRPSSASAA